MPVLLAIGVLAVLGAVAILAARDGDPAAWLTRVAASQLPADRAEWGRAMVAELVGVSGRGRRLRFAGGVLRVALFPPTRHRGRAIVAAMAGLAVVAGATVLAGFAVPGLRVFVAVLGTLLCAYAFLRTTHGPGPRLTTARVLVAVVCLAGLAATVASVIGVAVAHPTATADPTHAYSIAFALILVGYLAAALARPRPGPPPGAVLWWAVGAAAAIGLVGILFAATTTVDPDSVINLATPSIPVMTFVAAAGAGTATGSRAAGTRAGVLTILLGAPIQFAITVTAFLRAPDWTLTNAYDIAKYPRSGFPDVASYLLSDLIGGEIISGLVLYPLLLVAVALLGAVTGDSLSRRSPATPRAAGG